MRPALPAIRQEADNPTIKECLSITGGRALGCLGNDWLSGTGSNAVADVVFRKRCPSSPWRKWRVFRKADDGAGYAIP
ncbi:MAG TPA: hypothetical protein VFC15_01740, partial [Candidatus Limnocylindrales bacterium]|nr:hypothetical protein [Candidatus Limnocylindrales bacterium]